MSEIWKPVVGYEGYYEISSQGGLRSVPRDVPGRFGTQHCGGRAIITSKDRKGYVRAALNRHGTSESKFLHRLVIEAFLGPAPTPKMQVNHKDLNKANNSCRNLEWVLPKRNVEHAVEHGLYHARSNPSRAVKLSEREADAIAAAYQSSGMTQREVAKAFWGDVPALDIRRLICQCPFTIRKGHRMARAKQPPQIHQLTVPQFEAMFPDEDACRAYLKARRWPDGVHCPRCGNPKVYDLKTRKWHWQCAQCTPTGYRFSIIAGTIFENTNKPLRDWFRVIHLMLTSKKGMSARQVWRYMGFGSLETAWYMGHRVRVALMQDIDKLGGIVEVDETFVGGLAKNRHWDKRGGGGTGGIGSGKTPIVGAVSRKGNIVARVVANVTSKTLTAFVREAVSHKVSLLCTDQWRGYKRLDGEFPHATIDHARGQYVIGAIHTQTIEGFWSIFKRGVVGTFHKMSRKYMPLYVAEFQFRYNNRENADIFGTAIKGC